jgi:hypothetical protein
MVKLPAGTNAISSGIGGGGGGGAGVDAAPDTALGFAAAALAGAGFADFVAAACSAEAAAGGGGEDPWQADTNSPKQNTRRMAPPNNAFASRRPKTQEVAILSRDHRSRKQIRAMVFLDVAAKNVIDWRLARLVKNPHAGRRILGAGNNRD